MDRDLEELRKKVEKNELRARDAEARLKIVAAEIGILEHRQKLDSIRESD